MGLPDSILRWNFLGVPFLVGPSHITLFATIIPFFTCLPVLMTVLRRWSGSFGVLP